LQPQPVFLETSILVEPIEELAVGIATVVQESQRCDRFEHFAAWQFHAIRRIIGLHEEHFSKNLAEHPSALELAPGEHSPADVR